MPVSSHCSNGSYRSCSGSVKDWVEFLSSKQQLSSVGDKSEPITCIELRLREEDQAEDVRQLVNLLVRAISTHCAVFERLQHFKLEYKGRTVHSEKIYGYHVSWAYGASDAIPHHLDAMTRQICRLLRHLPLAITMFTLDASLFHPKLGTRMLASLSENRHLTELKIIRFNFASSIAFQINPPPWNVREWAEEKFGNNNEVCSSLMRAFFNGDTSRLQQFGFPNARANELDAEAIKLLKTNNHLQYLNLNCNFFGDAGASLIAEGLKVSKTLKRLFIVGCSIGDHGCMALAQSLRVNNTLEELYLDFNKFGDAGVRAFIATLRVNRSLRRLGFKSSSGYPEHSKETEEELLQVVCHYLLPLTLCLHCETKFCEIRLDKACGFNRDFDEKCQKLRDGTTNLLDKSFRCFLPLLGSTQPLVKQTVLFLLLQQRAEVASQSYLFMMGEQQSKNVNHCSSLKAQLGSEECVATILGEKGKGLQSCSNSAECSFASSHTDIDLCTLEQSNCTAKKQSKSVYFGIFENGQRLPHKFVSYCKTIVGKKKKKKIFVAGALCGDDAAKPGS